MLLAEPRGYCAGVDRAVETVERALERHGAPVYVRHEIVHNRHVVDTLAKAGAVFVKETDEVPEGAIVVFSAHGVAPTVHESAAERRLQVIDATCPLVTKVHNEAKRFARDDYDILLIGHEGHEEVVGTAGEAPDHVQLVDGPDAVDDVTVRDENKVVWLSQTTLSVDETMETVQRLRERFPELQDPPSDDICYATQNRQVAVKAMAPECELVIVVGSRNSSNSVRLVEVALGAGAHAAHLVDYADDIDPAWLDGVTTVGVTSGASVPEVSGSRSARATGRSRLRRGAARDHRQRDAGVRAAARNTASASEELRCRIPSCRLPANASGAGLDAPVGLGVGRAAAVTHSGDRVVGAVGHRGPIASRTTASRHLVGVERIGGVVATATLVWRSAFVGFATFVRVARRPAAGEVFVGLPTHGPGPAAGLQIVVRQRGTRASSPRRLRALTALGGGAGLGPVDGVAALRGRLLLLVMRPREDSGELRHHPRRTRGRLGGLRVYRPAADEPPDQPDQQHSRPR